MIIGQVLGKKRARPKGYNPAVSEMAARQESLELEKSLQVLTHTLRNAAPDVAGGQSGSGAASSEPANAYSKLVERIRVNQGCNSIDFLVQNDPNFDLKTSPRCHFLRIA